MANLYLGKLKANHIEAIVLNQKDSMYNAFGSYELYVKPEDVIRAKRLIKEDHE